MTSPEMPLIMGIETSCDDTSVAIVRSDRTILAHQTASSAAIHASHGGVVPEIAAREHLYALPAVIEAAMAEASLDYTALDGIAATAGPGLIGGVIVGSMTAKALASSLKKPYFAVNHLEGHALTARLSDDTDYPYLLLLVSGGHTQIIIVKRLGEYIRLGTTMDDAAGEAFDKGAALMGLGYPGGPQIQKLARGGDADAIALPEPRLKDKDCHFSFSGLKTAFAQSYQRLSAAEQTEARADYAASLQHAIAKALIRRVRYAMERYRQEIGLSDGTARLVVAGGVAANLHIRSELEKLADAHDFELTAPPVSLCVDNGAMIAWVGQEYHKAGVSDGFDTPPRPRWPLDKNAAPPPGRGVRG